MLPKSDPASRLTAVAGTASCLTAACLAGALAVLPAHARAADDRSIPEIRVYAPAGPAGTPEAGHQRAQAPSPAWQSANAAYQAYSARRYADAVAHARTAVKLAPDNQQYRQLLVTAQAAVADERHQLAYRAADQGYKQLARHDYAQAVASARDAVRLAPADAAYRRLLVSALAGAGALPEAEAAASAAIARNPTDAAMLAQRGFLRVNSGQPGLAADDFAAALKAGLRDAAQRRTVSLGLADAARAAGQPARAEAALEPYRGEKDYAVASRLGFALLALGRKPEALQAFTTAAGEATTPEERSTAAQAEINLLLDLHRPDEARQRFEQARASGELAVASPTNAAYLAVRVGDDATAARLFEAAAQTGGVHGKTSLDAAYAAKRAGDNTPALRFFDHAIDDSAAGRLPLAPQQLYDARREVASLERSWGALFSLSYGAVGVMPGFALPPSATGPHVLQAGSEAYWRPPVIGNRDGRTLEVFVRAFENLTDATGAPTGAPSLQGAAGLRIKPFSAINLVFEGARDFRIGDNAREDWLGRIAFSQGSGTDLRVEQADWPMWQVYAEYDRYLRTPETVVSFEARYGHSFRVDGISDRLVITPFVALGGNYDSVFSTPAAFGAGPGLGFRYWFRETKYAAPRSYIDFNVQYRVKLAGDNRARGIFAGLTLAF